MKDRKGAKRTTKQITIKYYSIIKDERVTHEAKVKLIVTQPIGKNDEKLRPVIVVFASKIW